MADLVFNEAGDALYYDGKAWVPARTATNDKGDKVAFDGKEWRPVAKEPSGRWVARPTTATTTSTPKPTPSVVRLQEPTEGRLPQIAAEGFAEPWQELGSFLGRAVPAGVAALTPGGDSSASVYAQRRAAQNRERATDTPPLQPKSKTEEAVRGGAHGLGELSTIMGPGSAMRVAPGLKAVGDFITSYPLTQLASSVLGGAVGGATDSELAGLATGLGVGVGTPVAGHLLKTVGNIFRKDIPLTMAQQGVRDRIYKALQEKGVDPQKVIRDLQSLGPDVTMADVHPALREIILETAGKRAGKGEAQGAGERVSEFYRKRGDAGDVAATVKAQTDPGGRSSKAAVSAKTTAEAEAARLAGVPDALLPTIVQRATDFFGRRQATRLSRIQGEIDQTLRPRQNIEANLKAMADEKVSLSTTARETFLADILPDAQVAEFNTLLQENKFAKQFYDELINGMRGVKENEAILPMDPGPARKLLAEFDKATAGMNDTMKKAHEQTFLQGADKAAYGTMDGVREATYGTKGLTLNLADRVRQWSRDAANSGYESEAANAAKRRATAEGMKLAQTKLDTILRDNNKEYAEWLEKLARLNQREEAVKLGRKAVSTDRPDQIPLQLALLKDVREDFESGFVSALDGYFKKNAGKTVTGMSKDRNSREAVEHVFGPQAAKQFFDQIETEAGHIVTERAILAPGESPKTIGERARATAQEWGGTPLFDQIERSAAQEAQQKIIAEAADKGSQAFDPGMTKAQLEQYVSTLSSEAKQAFENAMLARMAEDPLNYGKRVMKRKGSDYEKIVSVLGQNRADQLEDAARRRAVFGTTESEFESARKSAAGINEPGAVEKSAGLGVALQQAARNWIGPLAKQIVGAEKFDPMRYPRGRTAAADVMVNATPAEQAAYVQSLLNYKPQGMFESIAQRAVPPVVGGATAAGLPVPRPAAVNPDLLGQGVQSGATTEGVPTQPDWVVNPPNGGN